MNPVIRPTGRCGLGLRSIHGKPGGRHFIVALAGNPNTGKSTVFNSLTGLRQHTGNWPGKTVAVARGSYTYGGVEFVVVDLPGTYSLLTVSEEEQVATEFLLAGLPDVTVVVADATCLERNLNLALQVIEMTPRVVLCVNLVDEAARKGVRIDAARLSRDLGVPVVPTAARLGAGLEKLKAAIFNVATGAVRPDPPPIPYSEGVARAIGLLAPIIAGAGFDNRTSRWLAVRLLDPDERSRSSILQFLARNVQGRASIELRGVD